MRQALNLITTLILFSNFLVTLRLNSVVKLYSHNPESSYFQLRIPDGPDPSYLVANVYDLHTVGDLCGIARYKVISITPLIVQAYCRSIAELRRSIPAHAKYSVVGGK